MRRISGSWQNTGRVRFDRIALRAGCLVSVVARFESRLGRAKASVRQTGEVIHTISLVVWHRVAATTTGTYNDRRRAEGWWCKRRDRERLRKKETNGELVWRVSFEKRGNYRKSYKQSQERWEREPNYPRLRAKRINGEQNACKQRSSVTPASVCDVTPFSFALFLSFRPTIEGREDNRRRYCRWNCV